MRIITFFFINPCHAGYFYTPPSSQILILLTFSIPVEACIFNQSGNTSDPDQMALSEASRSGSTVFSKNDNSNLAGQRSINKST